jgi:hypothetical protein
MKHGSSLSPGRWDCDLQLLLSKNYAHYAKVKNGLNFCEGNNYMQYVFPLSFYHSGVYRITPTLILFQIVPL